MLRGGAVTRPAAPPGAILATVAAQVDAVRGAATATPFDRPTAPPEPRTAKERRMDEAARGVYALGWDAFPLLACLGATLWPTIPGEPVCIQVGGGGDGPAWAALGVGGIVSDEDIAAEGSAADDIAPELPSGPRTVVARLGAMLLEDARGHESRAAREAATTLRRAMKGAQNP